MQSLLESRQVMEKRPDLRWDGTRLSRIAAVILTLVFFALAGGGCAYHFQPTGKPHGLSIKSIAIPMVKSPSSAIGFEGEFTRAVREEFIDHSSLPVVPKAQADAVLVIRITRIGSDPLAYNVSQATIQGRTVNYETTSSRWLWLKIDARLLDRESGRVLWEQNGIREKAAYSVSTDPLETRYNRRSALRNIARNVAKKAYAQTMERF